MRLLIVAALAVGLSACGGEPEGVEPVAGEAAVAAVEASAAVDAGDAPRREITDGSEPAAPPVEAEASASTPAAETTATDGSGEQSCREQVGEAAAKALVDVCLNVSPATRPPCNAENSCALIESEIQRGCNLLGEDVPEDCPRM